jgi:predicted nucleotidyltransferase
MFDQKEVNMNSETTRLARRVAALFAELPQVAAIALSGSYAGESEDPAQIDSDSDIDLYVYTYEDIHLPARREIMELSGGARRASMGLNFWGPGDEWFDAETGIEVDMIYFDTRWMEDQIKRVVLDHQPGLGYSTCLWYTVRQSQVYDDPNGWFAGLQEICQRSYSETLRQNVIATNYPVLREIIPSYFFQIEKAVKRGDLVSVNHRLAGLLASYFDIIFAFNRELHPGEKRLIQKTLALCERLPQDFRVDLQDVLNHSGLADRQFLARLGDLLDHLDQLLALDGFSAGSKDSSG